MKEIRAIASGRVQMVMYRDFAQRYARILGIKGEVKNLKDGTVEVIAQGTEKDLKRLIEELERGPIFANVESVEVEWGEPSREYQDFKITY